MKKLLLLLLTLLAFTCFADKFPTDSFQIGDKSTGIASKLIFDMGDGASNPTISVDKTNKDFTLTKDLNIDTNFLKLGDGAGTTDIKMEFDAGNVNNPYFLWSDSSQVFEFSIDGLTTKQLGSAVDTGDSPKTQINIVANSGASNGTGNFTCSGSCAFGTTTTLAEVYSGDASFTVDFSATAETLKSDEQTIGGGIRDKYCQSEFYYFGGDTNIQVKVFNGNDAQQGSTLTLEAQTEWKKEYIFFDCPTQAAIGGDANLADLYVEFSSTADAALIRLDNIFIGERKGVDIVYYPEHDLTVSGVDWTTTFAFGYAYQIYDRWRLRFNMKGGLSSSSATLELTIDGVVFRLGRQAITAWDQTGVVHPLTAYAAFEADTLHALFSGAQTGWLLSGDVELVSKPTWLP